MSKIIPTGGPAFPIECNIQAGFRADEGMTLRDWFAGQALVGMMQAMRPYSNDFERSAREAYVQADAMLAEKFKADEINAQARKEEMDDDRPF